MVRREDIRAMQDAWRAYLDLALGLTETSRKKATKVAKKLVGRGGATAEQLQSMAEDLVSTSLANREALTRLVRYEMERALGRVGLATAEEVSALTSRVKELEQQLEEARDGRGRGTTPAPLAPLKPAEPATAAASPAKKAVAKKVVAKKAAPTKTVPTNAVATKAPAKKVVAKKAVASTSGGPVQPAAQVVPEVAAVVAAAAGDTGSTSTPAPTPTVRKAPAKKVPAKTATPLAKKAPAKKVVARRTAAPAGPQT